MESGSLLVFGGEARISAELSLEVEASSSRVFFPFRFLQSSCWAFPIRRCFLLAVLLCFFFFLTGEAEVEVTRSSTSGSLLVSFSVSSRDLEGDTEAGLVVSAEVPFFSRPPQSTLYPGCGSGFWVVQLGQQG